MRFFKYAGCMAALTGGLFSASAFSLLGPVNEAYQQPVIGHDLPGDIGAVKNIGEEYRWNTPVIFYGFEQTFTDYFGTNGIKEVEGAIAFLNALTNVGFSALDLNQFPLQATRMNPRASALNLRDLKTITLAAMLEELGLADSERFVWTLRNRWTQSGLSCPAMYYYVIMRNFDPFTYTYTPYINGVLYSYLIIEQCTGNNPLAITSMFTVDPTDPQYTTLTGSRPYFNGAYVVALSRDDVGGLKYLYRTNNVNWEALSSASEQFATNRNQTQLLFSSNLWTFASAAVTNNADALTALYPGLIITGTTNIFTNIWVTNLTAYFTNAPWMPVDAIPQLTFLTNRTLTIQTQYKHTFGNVFTGIETNGGIQLVQLSTLPTNTIRTRVEVQTITITNSPWLPIDYYLIDFDTRFVTTNALAGDFFILPTNACSVELIGLQATLLNRVTNSILTSTNSDTTGTNIFIGQVFSQDIVVTESNRVWLGYPVECASTNTSTLRQGVDRIQFKRVSYDSLIGRSFESFTNYYTSIEVTNSKVFPRAARRVVNTPDFLFRSEDLTADNARPVYGRNPGFATNSELTTLAGPGTIEPSMTITYNRAGPVLWHIYSTNSLDFGLNHLLGSTNFVWASYNGTTNAPVLYPTGITVGDIESILLFQILSFELPEGTVGVPYAVVLEGTGGQRPYTWSPDVNSAPLPAGLSLSANGVISGVPQLPGDFEVSITLTEAGARATTRTLTLHINP